MLDHWMSDICLPIGIVGSLAGLILYVALGTWLHSVFVAHYPALLEQATGAMATNLGQGVRAFSDLPALLRSRAARQGLQPSHRPLFWATRIAGAVLVGSLALVVLAIVLIPKS